MRHTVIIGVPQWRASGPAAFAERLVRGLDSRGHDAAILLTETGCTRVPETAGAPAPPDDLACDRLPAGANDTWGERWEALERYLEEHAPCCFVMLHDRRNNVIAPRLSRRVRIVGVVRAEDDAGFEQAASLGRWWDAIVATSDPISFRLASLLPQIAPRVVTIRESGSEPDDMITGFVRLFDRLAAPVHHGGRPRPRGPLAPPPRGTAGIDLPRRQLDENVGYVDAAVAWPDGAIRRGPTAGTRPATPPPALHRHTVLVATSPGKISGVDVFATHLVRGLRAHGIDARLHGRALSPEDTPGEPAADLPYDERAPALDDEHFGWLNRWRGMVGHLQRLAPCIYVPNYDSDFSCVAPLVPEGVRVVGIGHSDDPWHYEHLCRIGHACDAIVGVSHAISDHFRGLAPHLATRVETIPYGVVPPTVAAVGATGGEPGAGAPLRIIYTGRLVGRQKRALDLVSIARGLRARGVPFEMTVVGEGDIRITMERAAPDLIRERRLWFTGMQPNDGVLALLESSDVFLLPSAYEGLSVAMLEAMSRGVVPCVSAIRSGVPEAIDPGVNGLVAPVGDIAAFVDRLEWLWRNPAERPRLAAAARASVAAGYTLEQMIERYVALFRRVVAAPIARPLGPFVPPKVLERELGWGLWASRVAADPVASLRRIARRFAGRGL